MNPYDNGAMAATLVFMVTGIVSGIARRIAGGSVLRSVGISVVLYPVGLVFFGLELEPRWLAVSSVVGLLLVIWSQRLVKASDSMSVDGVSRRGT